MLHSNFYHSIKSEIKNNLVLSVPMIASQLIYASSGFIGTAMIAHLGKNALAASVLVSTIWMSLSILFFGILSSISVLVAHQFGAKNYKTISDIMGQAYILGIIACVPIILILLSMPLFLHWSAQPPEVLDLAKQYIHAQLWTIPGLVALVISEQFLAGIGHSKLVLRMSLLVVPVEIPIIYCLIFGKLGLPACGVAGVSYGFAITYSITGTLLMLYLATAKNYQEFKIFSAINKFNWGYLKELIRVGLPMGFMHVIEVSTFAVATFWISQFGTTTLAAHQIVLQYLGFFITIVFAMSQAVTVRVGHAVGRQNLKEVEYAIYVGMAINFFSMLFFSSLLFFAPDFFLRLDLNIHNPNNASLLHQASILLSTACLLMVFDNFRIIGFGALRGLKDTKFPMWASFISFWLIGLTTAYLLSFHFHLKGEGIWLGLTIGIISGAIIVFSRIQYLLAQVDLEKLVEIT